jgi:RNAse (barnase) inhibitor barstar
MKNTHLVPRKYGSKRYFHFRGCVPQDLISLFGGKKRFQISLKNVRNKDSLWVSVSLQTLTEQLFNDIRKGMKTLSLEDIKEILKVEVRKSILHSNHVYLETNKYDPQKIEDSLSSVSSREEKMKQKLKDDLKTYEGMLDEKLEKILLSLEIEYNNNSINHKKLRRYFIDLYLLRFEFTRNLINETGKTDDDFRREVDEKLKVELFPELNVKLTPIIENYIPEPYRVETPLTTHQSTLLSVGIENYIKEKGSIRTHSLKEIQHSLNVIIEEFGDIPIVLLQMELEKSIA